MSFAARNLSRALVRRTPAVAARRNVVTVPRLGTKEQMEKEAIEQIRARLSYQKEIMEANPHKSHAEEWAELWTWIKISIFFCGPLCIFAVTKDLLIEEHHHRPTEGNPEYMGIRNKEYPWECDSCDLFDMDCWKKCRADKLAGN
ncbi:unnamed protein product [Cylindrotheca closterium]|uniref:Cytochrome c oxidase subunit n=1 Tax=Cylindrotheca closterium TaxID=2856 RepID=A0AAD2G0Q5_9STRA|nr:unnamed protein product [Cylindrotheca closterium]